MYWAEINKICTLKECKQTWLNQISCFLGLLFFFLQRSEFDGCGVSTEVYGPMLKLKD